MKTETYPLALPLDLLTEIRKTAKDTGLSQADAMRQGLKLGLPKLREQLGAGRITNVEPLSEKDARRLYAGKDDDSTAIRRMMAMQSKMIEE